jgi:S1-C subfamily serine protease
MSDSSDPTVLSAAGNTIGKVCPLCDTALVADDPYLSCPSCLSPQHAGCWEKNDRTCGSYFCTKDVRRDVGDMGPVEIVITRDEAAGADPNTRPAPLPRRVTPSPVPVRRDPYATAALVLGVGSLVPFLGCMTGPFAVLIGAISFGRIGAAGELRGRGLAIAGLLLGVFATLGQAGGLAVWLQVKKGASPYGGDSPFLATNETPLPPSPDEVKNFPPRIRAAFRSNVFIEGRHRISAWIGSGIVVDATPTHFRVLTNRHVADGDLSEREGVELTVHTVTGQRVTATVLWRAPGGIDMALLEAALPGAEDLVDIARTAVGAVPPQVGSRVFAVGNPHSLGWSYTEGVVSSLRDHDQSGSKITFIQTQTPINPGNSGGGLYDMNGLLVGMNSWKISDSVGEGLSFAIAVKSVLEQRQGVVQVGPPITDAPSEGPERDEEPR